MFCDTIIPVKVEISILKRVAKNMKTANNLVREEKRREEKRREEKRREEKRREERVM